MKNDIEIIQFEFLGQKFKCTVHHGANVMEISTMGRKKWERIYFGHKEPLQQCIDFFNKSINPQ